MKNLKRLYIDECGNTGEDLLNEDQPVFVLASAYLSEEHSLELKHRFFSKINAKELKHKSLSKYTSQQSMIVNFIGAMANEPEVVKFAVAHKRYVLTTKIVDVIIEPMMFEDNVDFYQDGLNIAFSNMLYLLGQQKTDKKFFDGMLYAFQKMIIDRTYPAYESFFKPLFETKISKNLEEYIFPLKLHHHRYSLPDFFNSLSEKPLEIAFAEALVLVAKWSESINGNFSLIHDNSSTMAKNKKAWDKVLHPDIDPVIVGYDKRLMTFPIRGEKTDFENSMNFAGLQLVDILAGAMARCMKWNINGRPDNDDYAKELSTILPESFGGHILWPTDRVTPEDLGTVGPKAGDAIQHFVDLIKGI